MNVFIAGGIGITPFVSTVRHMEARAMPNCILHWATVGTLPLVEMFGVPLESERARLHNALVDAIPDITEFVELYGGDATAFCCAPSGMLAAFEVDVESWPDHRKHIERFSAPTGVPNSDAVPFTVVLARSNMEIRVSPEVGLLATLEAMNADVSKSCARGICGACRTRWLVGPPIHHDGVLSSEERESEVIVCVAACAGPRLVLDI